MKTCQANSWRARLACVVLTASLPTTINADGGAFTAVRVREFRTTQSPAMHMPTDVAVDMRGGIFVADGVNDRVLYFPPDETGAVEIRRIDDEALVRPTGLHVDQDGRLWIADTGNGRVVVRGADGRLVRILAAPAESEGKPADVTDVAVDAGGTIAWLVDNQRHTLLRFDVASGEHRGFGTALNADDALRHPFQAAVAADGAIFLTDVINARVQGFSREGQSYRPIGEYGVHGGQLYRPKGVACDAEGLVWVSDGTLGVVQVFRRDGTPAGVVRAPSGEPLRFQSPMGIAIAGDHLYVTELGADRVVQLQITRGKAESLLPSSNLPPANERQSHACTVCHIEWIDPFSHGRSTELMAAPTGTEDDPVVSRDVTCLSCHDGSVVDSRASVWREHGHRTGVKPPETMRVPEELPLTEGRIACRTCHAAHADQVFTGDLRTTLSLRISSVAGQLCTACHVDKPRGEGLGTHPVGGLPWPVPRELLRAGAKAGPNPREINCQVCHVPHGSKTEQLLVMGERSNQLCLQCHADLRPGLFGADAVAPHPVGGEAGAELRCVSCHRLHEGRAEQFLLYHDLSGGEACRSCHADKDGALAGPHDLRTAHPEERNRLGQTVLTGGACSACHLVHRPARATESHPLDARGTCVTCHQPDRCAGDCPIGDRNHPEARCADCHDPHNPRHAPYLKAPAEALCVTCHADQAGVASGPHDVHGMSESWPAASLEKRDGCLACHRPHGSEETGLFRVASAPGESFSDGACIACHADSAWAASGLHAAVHPRELDAAADRADMPPLEVGSGGGGRMRCATCHDPHAGGRSSAGLLRVAAAQHSTAVCTQCHSDAGSIGLTGHGHASLARAGLQADACLPCHTVHGAVDAVRPALLSLASDAAPSAQAADQFCVACHRPDGPALAPPVATHPDVLMPGMNVPVATPGGAVGGIVTDDAAGASASFPLFDQDGNPDPHGAIACLTCHLPHGREPDGPHTPAEPQAVDAMRENKARQLLLRPFTPPNLCTQCHGADALRRYLYFHDPVRRGDANKYK